jgi:hypothetical protein
LITEVPFGFSLGCLCTGAAVALVRGSQREMRLDLFIEV